MKKVFNNIKNFFVALLKWLVGYRVPYWFFLTNYNFQQFCIERDLDYNKLYCDLNTALQFMKSVRYTRKLKRRENRQDMFKRFVFMVWPFMNESKYQRYEIWRNGLYKKYQEAKENRIAGLQHLRLIKDFK
ncbi:MAG: hypothetical protein Q4E28_05090 [Clostridia bacterium]|nr:hypothetical protein [Clostridia bacterium]